MSAIFTPILKYSEDRICKFDEHDSITMKKLTQRKASPPPVVVREHLSIEFRSDAWIERSTAIAQRIITALKAKKMMQKDLAWILGVKPQQVSKILKGNINLTLETISKLENALDVTLLEVPSQNIAVIRHRIKAERAVRREPDHQDRSSA